MRARVVALQAAGVLVEHADATLEHVNFARVRQRARLPWKPEDLRDTFIVLRQRNTRREDYVEDLRVRRNLLRQLLTLLTEEGDWRPGHGTEPLHMYYTDFDLRPEHELESSAPGRPSSLKCQAARRCPG